MVKKLQMNKKSCGEVALFALTLKFVDLLVMSPTGQRCDNSVGLLHVGF